MSFDKLMNTHCKVQGFKYLLDDIQCNVNVHIALSTLVKLSLINLIN